MATYSILYSAVVSSSASTGSAGDVLILSTDGTSYVKATTANRGARRATGIALSSYVAGGVVDIAQTGEIPTSITGFAAAAASWVRCSTTGTLEKVTPGALDDLLGKVDADGRFFLDPGKWDSTNYTGVGAVTTTGSGSFVLATGPTISAPTISSTPTLSGASTSTSNDTKGTAVDVNPVHVQTTDATVTTLDSFTISSNSAVAVSWLVTAIKSDSTQAAAYSCMACFKNTSGSVTQVGTTTTTVIGESDSTWDCTVDNSTTTIRLRVTGAGTVQWTSILTRLTVIP